MKLCVLLIVLSVVVCCNAALHRNDPQVDRLIRGYWMLNKKYSVILVYLRLVHHVCAGMTWLKQRIKDLGLHKRGRAVRYSPIGDVEKAIKVELKGINSNVGYRQMFRILQTKHNIVVKRETVMMLMKLLDPDGVARRTGRRLKRRVYRNKGPNYVWHLDGYGKLKPYGFTIHGCIDGYSRKMLWLKLASTNNDPRVILLYYLIAVVKAQGVPRLVRSDCGTENSILSACHMTLRHYHDDEFSKEKSFNYGSSTTNTRIESWWAQLRNSVTDYWMNIFKDMIGRGILNPNTPVHRHSLAFVYGELVERSLNDFKDRWNSHLIRPSRQAACPSGVPDDLYLLPQLQGSCDYRRSLDVDAWAFCYTAYACRPLPFYPVEFEQAATVILNSDFNIICRSEIELN